MNIHVNTTCIYCSQGKILNFGDGVPNGFVTGSPVVSVSFISLIVRDRNILAWVITHQL